MPDVAPSTLFGDNWMVELIAHDGFRNEIIDCARKNSPNGVFEIKLDQAPKDALKDPLDPVDVRGIFSETEQWLWATNRCLRNWASVLDIIDSTDLIDRTKSNP